MNLLKQSTLYIVFGLIQLVVDWLCFVLLTWLGLNPVASNITGRIAGALLGFWLNGKHTFGTSTGGILRRAHLVRFIVMWCLTTALSTIAVTVADQMQGLYLAWLVKPFADAALAALGFLLSKYWVYK